MLKHDLAVSSRAVLHVVLFLELTHPPMLDFAVDDKISNAASGSDVRPDLFLLLFLCAHTG